MSATELTRVAVRTNRAASIIDVHPTTLRKWRLEGKGPRYSKIGRAVFYLVTDLEKFIAEHAVEEVER